jgi:predicted 3-demethylubiquinone-9 3-methyltransferase (glyoxalase superfamily)
MKLAGPIMPCLWFDTRAEEAAKFYCSIFGNSRIKHVARFPDTGKEIHGKDAGSVMTVAFEIDGQNFLALNGGPQFRFDEAVSFILSCQSQKEIDYFWAELTEDGGQESPCGWLKDKFGLSWQVTPAALPKMMTDPDTKKTARVMDAFMKMKKPDLAAIEHAYAGKAV